MIVVKNISQLFTLEAAKAKAGKNIRPEDLSPVVKAALVADEKVLWAGPEAELPSKFRKQKAINARGGIVLPGFVDSHTHLVFSGDRSEEFQKRLAGQTYQQIAAAGGGILKTVRATRQTGQKDLLDVSLQRVENFLAQGVTTLEVKSGYGLDFETEHKILKTIESLSKKSKMTIHSTYMPLHALPPEYMGRKREYVETVIKDWLPKVKSLVSTVDIFIDEGYFDVTDAELLFKQAKKLGLNMKVHADELALTGGTRVAVKLGLLSADHLLRISKSEVELLAHSEVTATLLPTTAFFLNYPYAPARELLNGGARVALASDFNPGTSPSQDVSFVAVLSALKMGMTIEEIVVAMTLNGAYALGLESSKGVLTKGYDADFVIFEAETPAALVYNFGKPGVERKTFCSGKLHS